MRHILLTTALILTATGSAAAANFFGSSITLLSNSIATSLCTENSSSEANQPNTNYALLNNLEAANRNTRTIKKYVAMLEVQPERFKAHLETIDMLKASQIKVYFDFVSKQINDKGAEGFITPLFSNNVLITISTSEKSILNLNGKIAHELEHARQIAVGELAYQGVCIFSEKEVEIRWTPNSYDLTDERKAYSAQLALSPAIEDYDLLKRFRAARTEAAQEIVLSGSYPKLERKPKTNNFITAGELVMPRYQRIYLAIGTKKED